MRKEIFGRGLYKVVVREGGVRVDDMLMVFRVSLVLIAKGFFLGGGYIRFSFIRRFFIFERYFEVFGYIFILLKFN